MEADEAAGREFLERFRANPRKEMGGFPALHQAILKGAKSREVKKMLVKENALEEAAERHRYLTALEIAAGVGRPDIVSLLVKEFGLEALLQASPRSHPLHMAVDANCVKSAEVLLDAGADIEELAKGDRIVGPGTTPLQSAAASDSRINCLKFLIGRKANMGYTWKNGGSALLLAANKGALACVKELIRQGANIEEKGFCDETAVHRAVWSEKHDCLVYLLEQGADPNVADEDGKTPLGVATWICFLDGMRALLRYKADINQMCTIEKKRMSPLHLACTLPRETCFKGTAKHADVLATAGERMKILVQFPSLDVNSVMSNGDCCTPLHLLVREGNEKRLKYFVETCQPNLEEVNIRGETAAMVAASSSKLKCLKVLLYAGAESKGAAFHHDSFIIEDTRKCVALLAFRGADPNHQHRFETPAGAIKTTPLCRAAIMNMVNYVTILVYAGANVDFVDAEGKTALHYSVMEENVRMTYTLLEFGASPGKMQSTGSGDTPLHIAMRKANLELVVVLMMRNLAISEKKNLWGETPLQSASEEFQALLQTEFGESEFAGKREFSAKCKKVAQCLKKAFTVKEERQMVDLHQIVSNWQKIEEIGKQEKVDVNLTYSYISSEKKGRVDIEGCVAAAATLVQGGESKWGEFCAAVNHHSKKSQPALKIFLSVAIIMNNLEAVKKILSKKRLSLNNDINGQSFLTNLRGKANSLEILAELVEHGAKVDVQAEKESPLFTAVHYGVLENVQYLLAQGADTTITSEDMTLVQFAVANGHDFVLEILLQNDPAMANSKGACGCCPIHVAALCASQSAINILLEHGASAEKSDDLGNNVLHYSIRGKKEGTTVLDFFLNLGINPSSPNEMGDSPLHIAAQQNNTTAAEILIRAGADINARNNYLQTPLYVACFNRSKDVMMALLHGGADVNATNTFSSETALHVCARKDISEEAQILIKAGANKRSEDCRAYTPLEAATENNSTEVGVLLLQHLEKHDLDAMNRTVHCNYFDGTTRPMNFLQLAAFWEKRSDLIRSLVVEEREFPTEVRHYHPRRRKTRLHPCLDLVGDHGREEAEKLALEMAKAKGDGK